MIMIKINTYYILIQGWRAYGVPTIRSDLPAPDTRPLVNTKVRKKNIHEY